MGKGVLSTLFMLSLFRSVYVSDVPKFAHSRFWFLWRMSTLFPVGRTFLVFASTLSCDRGKCEHEIVPVWSSSLCVCSTRHYSMLHEALQYAPPGSTVCSTRHYSMLHLALQYAPPGSTVGSTRHYSMLHQALQYAPPGTTVCSTRHYSMLHQALQYAPPGSTV